MPENAVPLVVLASAVWLLTACVNEHAVSVELELPSGAPVPASYTVRVYRGGACPTSSDVALDRDDSMARIYDATFAPGETAPAIGALPEGETFALAALARDATCGPIAGGCVTWQVGSSDAIRIPLASITDWSGATCAAGRSCMAGRCVSEAMDGGQDAGPRDGGTRDGGVGTDARVDASVGPDPCEGPPYAPSALVCDDFESGALDAWTQDTPASSAVVITNLHTHRSSAYAVRAVTAAAVEDNAAAIESGMFSSPIVSGDLWVRAHYYVPSGFTLTGFSLFEIHEPAAPDETIAVRAIVANGTAIYRSVGDETVVGVAPFARDRWFCVQLHIEVSDTGGVVELDVDGARSVTITRDTRPAHGYSWVLFGISSARGDQGAAELFVDDVGVALEPLPCAR